MHKAIAHIISPINFIAMMSAKRHLEYQTGSKIQLSILHYYPTEDKTLGKEIYEVIQNMASGFDNEITSLELISHNNVIQGNYECARNADYIFYAHDVVTDFPRLLKEKNKNAKVICYGDALGQFFERDVHLAFLSAKPNAQEKCKRAIRYFKRLLRRSSVPVIAEKPNFMPDMAILGIPVSQAFFPEAMAYEVIEQNIIKSVTMECVKSYDSLEIYCDDLVTKMNKPAYFFMTENMAEGGFVSLEKEIELYRNAIELNCPKGATIIIKPHPGETYSRTDLLKEIMGDTYDFIEIAKKYNRCPAELFVPIINNATTISMYYPVLSFKYLYGVSVIQPLTNKIIERFFSPRVQESYKNSIDLNMKALERLDNWDGQSFLYNGQ